MINRRRRRTRVELSEVAAESSSEASDLQRALRLGWAVAETFGRLRTYQPEFANTRNDPSEMPRFSYSNGDLSGGQHLEVSYRRLIELATALNLDPPDLPELADPLATEIVPVLDSHAKKRVYSILEAWSRRAWIQLNVRSANLGRAMTYGGSLADTYWYMAPPGTEAFRVGRQSVEALLRPQRLRRMQERMDEISAAFNPDTCDAIGWSLGRWMLDEPKRAWATTDDWRALAVEVEARPRRTPPEQLHFNLFRQVRTWRDLLFESRQPLDYVSPGFRRRANLIAGAITILMVISVAIVVGVLVFLLFNGALAIARNSDLINQIGNEIVEAISVFLSLISTLAVVTAGLLSRASSVVQQFDTWLETTIIRRTIRRRTLVPWNDPPRKTSGD